MINGVLVERTVQDVVPALKTNAEGLKKVLNDLVKQYQSKQEELDKWKVCLVLGVSRASKPEVRVCVGKWSADKLSNHTEEEQRPGCSVMRRRTIVLGHDGTRLR